MNFSHRIWPHRSPWEKRFSLKNTPYSLTKPLFITKFSLQSSASPGASSQTPTFIPKCSHELRQASIFSSNLSLELPSFSCTLPWTYEDTESGTNTLWGKRRYMKLLKTSNNCYQVVVIVGFVLFWLTFYYGTTVMPRTEHSIPDEDAPKQNKINTITSLDLDTIFPLKKPGAAFEFSLTHYSIDTCVQLRFLDPFHMCSYHVNCHPYLIFAFRPPAYMQKLTFLPFVCSDSGVQSVRDTLNPNTRIPNSIFWHIKLFSNWCPLHTWESPPP